MKTLTKSKAILFALAAVVMSIALAFALTACKDGNKPEPKQPEGTNEPEGTDAFADLEEGTYKLGATLEAGIPMGNSEPEDLGGVLSSAYVTVEEEGYTLSLIFAAKQIEINGVKATMFVGEGTNGLYDSEGELIEGVEVGYSKSYVMNSQRSYVGYVTSLQVALDSVSSTYDMAIYIDSDVMGYQFSNESTHKAQLKLNLDSCEAVEATALTKLLGADTLLESPKVVETMTFTVDELAEEYNLAVYVNAFNASALSGMQFPYTSSSQAVTNAVLTISEDEENEGAYTATLNAVVSMGGTEVNFTKNLIEGIEIVYENGEYTITLTFCIGTVNMPYGSIMTGYMNGAASKDYFNNDVVPQYGYYDGETLVTEGVELTYKN